MLFNKQGFVVEDPLVELVLFVITGETKHSVPIIPS